MSLLGCLNTDDSLYTQVIKENLENRVLVLNEDIENTVVENYMLHIIKWNMEDKDLPVEKRSPILLLINTNGGSTFDGNGLISLITASKTPVYGVALGLVASMGFYIYICCHKRYAFHDSVLLQHDGNVGVQTTGGKAKQVMNFFDKVDARYKEIVLAHTNMTSEYYDSIYEEEHFMYAYDEGKTFGCVDYIIGEDCDIDELFTL